MLYSCTHMATVGVKLLTSVNNLLITANMVKLTTLFHWLLTTAIIISELTVDNLQWRWFGARATMHLSVDDDGIWLLTTRQKRWSVAGSRQCLQSRNTWQRRGLMRRCISVLRLICFEQNSCWNQTWQCRQYSKHNTSSLLSGIKARNTQHSFVNFLLIVWCPLLSYGYSYKASCARQG